MSIHLSPLVNALGWALVHFVWQGLILALTTGFALFILKRSNAQTRYAVNCLALLLALCLPISEVITRLNQSDAAEVGSISMVFLGVAAEQGTNWASIQGWIQEQISWFVLGWMLVVLLLATRLIVGLVWLKNYHKGPQSSSNHEWQRCLDALTSRFMPGTEVLLRVVEDIQSPLTIGWLRPIVLVPASLVTGMAPAHLEALLAHELAHIRRYDFLINLIQNLIEMFLFFHPAVWWISRNIRIERENIADDLAAQVLGEPRRLALALQELEHIQFVQSQLALAAHGGNLMLRIKRLVRPEVQSINWKTAVTAVGIATACVAFAANAALPKYAIEANSHGNVIDASANALPNASSEEMEPPLIPNFDAEKANAESSKDSKPAKNDVVIPARINFAKTGCKPEYPRAALRKELQGRSSLLVHVSATGAITDVDIVKSSGHDLLDDAVKNQLLSGKCTNKPGTINGKPQQTNARVDYVWKLD